MGLFIYEVHKKGSIFWPFSPTPTIRQNEQQIYSLKIPESANIQKISRPPTLLPRGHHKCVVEFLIDLGDLLSHFYISLVVHEIDQNDHSM